MADIRFQFILNGQPVCLAGAEGFGVFSSCISWVRRNADEYEAAKQEHSANWARTQEEWTRESLGITAGTRDTRYPDYASWFDCELKVGDELTIRILGPGECDCPNSAPSDDGEDD
jgi:hypothetical protein